ncbi:MAG: LemA family protein, partial [Cytophagales bacterium]|nr:LemA family protein [Rhizobacter sp.]
MNTTSIVSWIVLAVLVFWGVGAYNRLVRLRNVISNSFAQ